VGWISIYAPLARPVIIAGVHRPFTTQPREEENNRPGQRRKRVGPIAKVYRPGPRAPGKFFGGARSRNIYFDPLVLFPFFPEQKKNRPLVFFWKTLRGH